MRKLAGLIVSTLSVSGIAAAQQPTVDHLLSEEEYLNTPAYPAPTPQPGDAAAQPYYGQPQQPYAGQPAAAPPDPYRVADDEDDVDVDDDVYQLDDGWESDAWTDFDQTLSPYGSWIDSPDYGRVWMPSVTVVGAGFFPYASNGHWVLTDYGWTWVSDWDWGWAPFHYGRWINVGGYGWCWRPGRLWGPAWVAWRHGGGYVGWAPLGPRGWRVPGPLGFAAPWRFTVAGELGALRPRFVPSSVVPSIAARTAPIANLRSLDRARFNMGPHASAIGHVAAPTPVSTLGRVAPHAGIAPRYPVNSIRPLAPAVPSTYRAPTTIGPRPTAAPSYAPRPTAAPSYTPRPYAMPRAGAPSYRYAAPSYATPRYGYRPSPTPNYGAYRAPAYGYGASHVAPSYATPHYAAPSYAHAPAYAAPHYAAPSYHPAPSYSAPHYAAPSYHAAPSYSAPHYSAPSYHPSTSYSAPHYSAPATHFGGGGGFHFGGGGGGHGHR